MNQHSNIDKSTAIILRIISALMIAGMLLLLLFSYIKSNPAKHRINAAMTEAHFDLGTVRLEDSPPVYLNGVWDYFPSTFVQANNYDSSLFDAPERISFPVTNITKINGSATYRLHFKAENYPRDALVLYIPDPQNNFNVFLNGKRMSATIHNQGWLNYTKYPSVFYLTAIEPELGYQELVVSSDGSEQSLGVFRRELVLTTMHNLFTLKLTTSGNELLVVGFLMVMMISSFIFMLFRPEHRMITAMTLFDSLLTMRVIFGLNSFIAITNSILLQNVLTDRFCYSMQIFFLCMAGIAGMKLSHDLYDEEGRTPKILTIPPAALYLLFGLVFPFQLKWFATFGIPLLLANFLYTFLGVFWQFRYRLRHEPSFYYILQMIKTLFVGALVFFDILFWNQASNHLLMVIAYCFFFVTHIAFRLYDNNSSYRQVDLLNRDLERTVAERTKKLENAYQRLRQISIRDPLTHAFNRLHFERTLKDYLEQSAQTGEAVHMVLFDLDFFKRINDTYGHDEGDRQLIYAVTCCGRTALPNSTLFRIGGEEFTLLFIGESDVRILAWTETLRQTFAAAANRDERKTTASIGIARYQDGMTEHSFFKAVDNCLYRAKNTGRNCICYDFEGKIVEYTVERMRTADLKAPT